METTAIYPGSFDPPTLGHISLIRRAAAYFHDIVVLVANNPGKDGWLPVDERVAMLEEALEGADAVRVCATDDLVVAFAARIRPDDRRVVLLRGVRDSEDLEHELLLAHTNRELSSGIETFLLPASRTLQHISSTEVRRRVEAGEDVAALLHPKTAQRLVSADV